MQLTVNIAKYHFIFILIALIAISVKFYMNHSSGNGVYLEYQGTKDRYWTRNMHLSVKQTFKNLVSEVNTEWLEFMMNFDEKTLDFSSQGSFQDDLSSVVVECRAHCRGSSVAGAKLDFGECTSRPVLIMDNLELDERKLRSTTSAKASIPCFMRLSDSVIPGANKGIFTDVFLSKGTLFGPYTGYIKGEEADVSWYTWKIDTSDQGKNVPTFYVDGDDEIFSNWLRWVNSARFAEEQNMIALSFNQSIYYYLYKDVQAGEELMVWYGKDYARYLAITALPESKYDWASDFAPPKSVVVCPSCYWSKGYADMNLKDTFLDDRNKAK